MNFQQTIRLLSLALLALALLLAFSVLSSPVLDLSDIFNNPRSLDRFVFFHLRLPRQIMAFLIGAGLSVAGVSFQSLLKNPLADPYILGISGGAALGYVVAVALALPFYLMPVTAFVFALGSLTLIYRLAQTRGVLSVVNLLLIGVIFNSFSFAVILLINSLATFGQAHQILNLLLGSIESAAWPQIGLLALFIATGLGLLLQRANQMNLLSLGDEEAFHLGVNVNREKKFIFVLTSLLVGVSVSFCGLIGFVGLFVPHLIRLVFGADHRIVLPVAVLGGGIFLMISDFIAGHLLIWESLQTQLPVGVITALLGAPIFVYLLKGQVGENGGITDGLETRPYE